MSSKKPTEPQAAEPEVPSTETQAAEPEVPSTETQAPTSTALMSIEDQLAALAAADAAKEVVSNPSIGTQGGVFTVDKADAGTKLQMVIVSNVFANFFYEGDFDPDNPSSPVCYAYGTGDDDAAMFPHEECEKPQCNEGCAKCPMNQWGTADKGKGKVCKNTRLLSVVSADEIGKKGDAQVYTLKVPVTSTAAFKVYVKKTAEALKRPLFAVVTEVSLERHKQHQFHMVFRTVGVLDTMDTIKYWMERRDQLAKDLMAPLGRNSDRQEQAKPERSGKY